MGKASKKPQKGAKAKKKSVKQQIRGIERLLKKEDLPATVRESQERMMAMLRTDHKDHQKQILEQKMQKKYRMVRFFEKRKLLRRIQQCRKKLSSAEDDDRPGLEEALTELRKDYNYVEHFPKSLKYISLLSAAQSAKTVDEKLHHRQEIADKVSSGSLPDASVARTREGKGKVEVNKEVDEDGDEEEEEDESEEEEEEEEE